MVQEAVNGSWKAIHIGQSRDEEPMDILNDIRRARYRAKARSLTIIDRREAIKTAYALAKEDDVVLVAGKGHENYQIIKG